MRLSCFLLFFILLQSCETISSGVVIEKHYEEANSRLVSMPVSNGKTTIFTTYMVYDNEDWVLTIEGESEGKTITQTVYVTEQEFNSVNVGDNWEASSDSSLTDDNNTREKQ